ncbi:MAG TPA: hypothetical protein VN455_10895 [Methanotrichaceae archaeon]|nr:hypothetical protein [Methanotrichaceae archaeon]
MDELQFASVIVEVLVTVLGVLLATSKRKLYGWFIALTFAIYVVYDAVNFLSLDMPKDLMKQVFLVASLSALIGIWLVFRDAKAHEAYVYTEGNWKP